MGKHLAATTTPYRIPAHYLTADTQDYPLVLLAQGYDIGEPDLPVAHGVTLLLDARYQDRAEAAWHQVSGHPCIDCGQYLTRETGVAIQIEESGGGNPIYLAGMHMACLLAEDSYGVVPTSVVEWVPVA